jgi:molybdenum cofactor cytidylyltransferase
MISGILLAAGNSKRMGDKNKLLLPVKGETLFVKMVRAMENSKLDELIVVLGHDYKRMIPHCNSNKLKLAINGNHLEGQTTSIKAGMQLINPSSDAVMICLADMPLITEEHLNTLISTYQDGKILRPMNEDVPGNPSVFPKALFTQILDCPDKDGCKSVITQNNQLLDVFESKNPAYFSDIDTPSEYAKFAS